jgi:sugar/nucleoside kinase (ribokinase family)
MDELDSALCSIPNARIAVVGNANLDVRTSPIAPRIALFRDGETTVGSIVETVGGGAANTAIAAAIMGASVDFYGVLGMDRRGSAIASHFARFGVHLMVPPKHVDTGISVAVNWTNRNRHFLSHLPNSEELTVDDLDLDGIESRGYSHIYRGDIWFSERMLARGNVALFEKARRLGIDTSVDINWNPAWNRGSRTDSARSSNRACWNLLEYTTYVHGNQRELCKFTGERSLKGAVRKILERGTKTVIIHLGSKGCALGTEAGIAYFPSKPVERITYNSGTGDVFTAALLSHGQMDLPARLQIAARLAADYISGQVNYLPRLGVEDEQDNGEIT